MNEALITALTGVILAAAILTARRFRCGGGCCGEHETVVRTRKGFERSDRYPYTVRLTIGSMTCENCARKVENALNAMVGVRAKVRFEDRIAVVKTEKMPEEAALKNAVAQAGYVVTEYEL